MQFTKLFNSILDSTIWQEPVETKIVWITMLAMVDRNGEVHASVPGLAKRAGVTLDQCEHALDCLMSPDKYSRTKDHDGRRVAEIDGGWELLNHGKYRALLSAEERKEYNRRKQAEYRAKAKVKENVNDVSMTVNHNKQNAHITEAEADTELKLNNIAPTQAIAWSEQDGWQNITDKDRLLFRQAYPAVNLDMQLAKANAWLLANPAKAHKKLWRKFLTGWLSRSQERGGDIQSNQPIKSAI